MFQNQASDATFQNLPPDTIFCDHESDVYHEWQSVEGADVRGWKKINRN